MPRTLQKVTVVGGGWVVSNLRLVFSLGPKLNNTQNCKKLPSTPISHQNWQNGYKLSQPQLNHNITSTVFVCDMKMTLNKLGLSCAKLRPASLLRLLLLENLELCKCEK